MKNTFEEMPPKNLFYGVKSHNLGVIKVKESPKQVEESKKDALLSKN